MTEPQTTQYDEAAEWKARYLELVGLVRHLFDMYCPDNTGDDLKLTADKDLSNSRSEYKILMKHKAKLLCEVLGL